MTIPPAPDDSAPTAFEQAIEAVDRTYTAQRSLMVWRTRIMWRDGGPDPLDNVGVFVDPRGFLTYVGLGLSELEEKRSPNEKVSGFGFELVLRYAIDVPPEVDLSAPDAVQRHHDLLTSLMPFWPVSALNRLARYVFDVKRPLVHTDFMHLRGAPFHPYLGFRDDPELGAADTVNGRFVFRQVFPLDGPEALGQLERATDQAAAETVLETWTRNDPHLLWHASHGPPPEPSAEDQPPPEKRPGLIGRLFGKK